MSKILERLVSESENFESWESEMDILSPIPQPWFNHLLKSASLLAVAVAQIFCFLRHPKHLFNNAQAIDTFETIFYIDSESPQKSYFKYPNLCRRDKNSAKFLVFL